MSPSALLVIDMQNGFCHPDGSLPSLGLSLAGVEAAVRHTADVIERTKQSGEPVIFTRHVYRPGRADEGANLSRKGSGVAEIDGLAAERTGEVAEEAVRAIDRQVVPGQLGGLQVPCVGHRLVRANRIGPGTGQDVG